MFQIPTQKWLETNDPTHRITVLYNEQTMPQFGKNRVSGPFFFEKMAFLEINEIYIGAIFIFKKTTLKKVF